MPSANQVSAVGCGQAARTTGVGGVGVGVGVGVGAGTGVGVGAGAGAVAAQEVPFQAVFIPQ